MRFGEVPVADALGAVLAHSVAVDGGRLRKGQLLTSADVTLLTSSGYDVVTVARLEAHDLDEDSAATKLAQALSGDHLRQSTAATGRVNLFADRPGIARIDVDAIAKFNSVNPMITVATVPQYHRINRGTMVATIKIISYGVPDHDVDQACEAGRKALHVLPPCFETATLIETRTADVPSTKGRAAMQGRLDRMQIALDNRVVIGHDVPSLSRAITEAPGDVVFILTASATSDPADVGPEGLRQAGGTVTQFGMPVDPGNLLFLGKLGKKPVIGLPGCARSPALNGADWVLERVLCGVKLTPADFAAMGVGGLLKEIPTRPKPREDYG